MTILDKIVAYKKKEVEERKSVVPYSKLEKAQFFSRETYSLKTWLLDPEKSGIITEFKRQSPSRGIINGDADVRRVTEDYARFGASGLSILTDKPSFGGDTTDLEEARALKIPILRKDFMVDEYQVLEAKAMGADVILLIAACLSPAEVKNLASLAGSLGLETLLELHGEDELAHVHPNLALIGINNRNLKTFEVDLERSMAMAQKLPAASIKIAESGISDPATVRLLRANGFQGFLMGENFMKEADPGAAFAKFVHQLKEHAGKV